MTMLLPLLIFTDRLLHALSHMLLHSVWQGLLLVLAIAAIKAVVHPRYPSVRYGFGVLVIGIFLLVCCNTFANGLLHEASRQATDGSVPAVASPAFLSTVVDYIQTVFSAATLWLNTHPVLIPFVWMLFCSFRLLQLTAALMYNRRMTRQHLRPPAAQWATATDRLRTAIGIKKTITLLESVRIQVPVVIGHLKPVILIPAGWLLSLPVEQVNAILLHELAHIRRRDYLVNMVQHVIEALFFFNPGFLWASSWLREERENCCDDIALQQTRDAHSLAAALLFCKEEMMTSHSYQTAFFQQDGQLSRRIHTILGLYDNVTARAERCFVVGSFMVLSAFLMLVFLKQPPSGVQADLISNVPAAAQKVAMKVDRDKVSPVQPREIKTTAASFEKESRAMDSSEALHTQMYAHAQTTDDAAWPPAAHTALNEQPARLDEAPAENERQLIEKLRQQVLIDQQQAAVHQQEALIDMENAKRAQWKATLDQQAAAVDQQRALVEQEEALKKKLLAEQAFTHRPSAIK